MTHPAIRKGELNLQGINLDKERAVIDRADREAEIELERAPFGRLRPAEALVEETIWKRALHPRARRWGRLADLDEKTRELDSRESETRRRLDEAHAAVEDARVQDERGFAQWQLNGGTRPSPTLPAAEQQVEELLADLGGIEGARAEVLEQKADFIARHRSKLTKDAEGEVKQARERYEAALDAAAEARRELAECRGLVLWAALFGTESHLLDFPQAGQTIGGGVKALRALGLNRRVDVDALFAHLREHDGAWVAMAVSDEQRRALGVNEIPDPEVAAVWTDSAEGRQALQRQGERARERLAAARSTETRWE